MLKKIGLGLLGVLAIFGTYVATQPSEYQISRSITINAKPDGIFPYINDAKKMNEWNPWMDIDPAAKVTFSGPEAGVGATTHWEGGKELGTGSATVVQSVENVSVTAQLEYVKPFAMTKTGELRLDPTQNGTVVTWSVKGHNGYLSKVMCVFMDMDKMVGGTIEKGLQELKAMAESPPTKG